MGAPTRPGPGQIAWIDLTVDRANEVRDFYRAVAGWEAADVDMGGYADYAMHPPGAEPVAGVCHARGVNAGLPAQWLIYITVEQLDRSMEAAVSRGGAVLHGPRDMGQHGRMCVVRDPAEAVAALIQLPPRS
jgi:hypothetical protein